MTCLQSTLNATTNNSFKMFGVGKDYFLNLVVCDVRYKTMTPLTLFHIYDLISVLTPYKIKSNINQLGSHASLIWAHFVFGAATSHLYLWWLFMIIRCDCSPHQKHIFSLSVELFFPGFVGW